MTSRFVSWVKTQNAHGHLLWLRSMARMKRSLVKRNREFWRPETIYKAINPFRWSYYKKQKMYEDLVLGDKIRHGVYKVFLKRDGESVYIVKIPRKDTRFSRHFVRSIRREEDYIDFCNTLRGLTKLKYLSEHIVEVVEIYRDGGYVSPYINGYNLAEVLEGAAIIERNVHLKLKQSANELICNLEKFLNEFGYIHGDWDLQNLVYDETENRIMIVDLEGFFIYRNGEIETQIERIKENLHNIKTMHGFSGTY